MLEFFSFQNLYLIFWLRNAYCLSNLFLKNILYSGHLFNSPFSGLASVFWSISMFRNIWNKSILLQLFSLKNSHKRLTAQFGCQGKVEFGILFIVCPFTSNATSIQMTFVNLANCYFIGGFCSLLGDAVKNQ